MKDEDVGGAIVGDDLALELFAEGGLDGEEAANRRLIRVAAAFH